MDEFGMGYAIGSNESNGNRNDGMFGDGNGWLGLIVILALFGGFGYGGWGGNGGGGGALTRSDLCEGFNFAQLDNGVRGIERGICDSTYALTGAINNGFSSAELSRCNQQAAVMQQLNNMAYQAQNCCCEIQRAIDGVKYDMATGFCAAQNTANNNTRDIIQSNHNDTDRVIAKLDQMEANRQAEKIQALQLENQNLKFQASQTAQNGYIDAIGNSIVARLQPPSPVPSYSVPAPYPYATNCGWGCNNGCGC